MDPHLFLADLGSFQLNVEIGSTVGLFKVEVNYIHRQILI